MLATQRYSTASQDVAVWLLCHDKPLAYILPNFIASKFAPIGCLLSRSGMGENPRLQARVVDLRVGTSLLAISGGTGDVSGFAQAGERDAGEQLLFCGLVGSGCDHSTAPDVR